MAIRSRPEIPHSGSALLGDYVELATWSDGAWFGAEVLRHRPEDGIIFRSFDLTWGLTMTSFSSHPDQILFNMRVAKPRLREGSITRVELGRWRWFLSETLPQGSEVSDLGQWTSDGWTSDGCGMSVEHAELVPGELCFDPEPHHLLGQMHPIWLAGDPFEDWVESVRREAG